MTAVHKERDMKTMRTVGTVVLAVAIPMMALGCGKKKEGGEGGAAALVTGAGGGGGKSALAVFPKDSNLVAGVNLGSVRSSKLFSSLWPTIEGKVAGELGKFKDACGIDPMTALQSISFGGNVQNEGWLIAVKGAVGKDKVTSCVEAMAKKEGKEIKIEQAGNFVGFKEIDEDKTQWIGWLDDSTIVTGPGAADNKAWLAERMSGKESAIDNADLKPLLGKVDQNGAFWLAMIPPADKPMALPGGASPKGVYVSVGLSAGLKLDVGLGFATPEEAKQSADQTNAMLGMAKADPTMGKFIAKAQIAAAGNDMTVKLDLNEPELDELVNQVKQQLPMLMMMMGG